MAMTLTWKMKQPFGLIHWLLATNFEFGIPCGIGFLIVFDKAEFTSEEAANALVDFVKNNVLGKHSERTVKQELPMILRTHCPVKVQIVDNDMQLAMLPH